jgi:hypothetical protein
MSRAFLSARARCAFHSHPLVYTPPLSMRSLLFLDHARLISVVSTRRLHAHAEAVPSAIPHSVDSGRRIQTQSADVSEPLVQYLNQTFSPLNFPPALAQRVLTHLSHRDSVTGHNSRFAFLGADICLFPCFYPCHLVISITGRRTLEAYLFLFLQGLPAAAEHDHSRIVARVLNTHALGENVAPHWRLEDFMRWAPPRAGYAGLDGRATGLHKVAGTTVEAVVGGVLHQFVNVIYPSHRCWS